MECMSWGLSSREISTKKNSSWIEHMKNNTPMITIPYGPTTAKMVPPMILEEYSRQQYGKSSPCQFPFENGVYADPALSGIIPLQPDQYTNNMFQQDQDRANMEFAVQHWHVPKHKCQEWKNNAGNMKQMEYTAQVPNLDTIEVDNSISPQGCSWKGKNRNNPTAVIKVIGWNTKRGKYWDKFYTLIKNLKELEHPDVILLNKMDIGMARNHNVHTTRQLVLSLGMNYAFGVELN